jgi:hypothetical protein
MKKNKIIKIAGIIVIAALIIAIGTAYYMFNKPHRDVQHTQADYILTASELVAEYLNDAASANEKYLSSDGESKILELSGLIKEVSKNMKGETVILLLSAESLAGVSATLDASIEIIFEKLVIGKNITIKGVIRSGAIYDTDMEMYRNAVLDKCSIIQL